tara:strand:+ start:809 stop:1258 length:450 start_codon:yes stop_codon:yes gene_type:complete
MDTKTIDNALGVHAGDPVLEDGLKITEKDLEINPVSGRRNEIVAQQDWGDVNDIDRDYEYQRKKFHELVEKGSTAIDGILELAKEGEHPRGYEVAGNLIKQVAEVTEKLGDLQEKMKRLNDVPSNAPKNVTNALFVGSTAELQKMIKGK